MEYKKLNNITGWIVFAIATFTYLMTLEPTTSLWDCGEYITTSNKLEVGHPPGAPTFMILGRLFSFFAGSENVAMCINAMSGLCSSFTILFLFWTITAFTKSIAIKEKAQLAKGQIIAILFSGAVGALAYTFSDSFWFSAVEGEVYAMSSLFTAVTFWAILKWESVFDEAGADRWIVLIAFLIGLSIGVHLLNLLAIPAVGYVYYFKKYKKTTVPGFIITGIISLFILVAIQEGVIPGLVQLAANIEIAFVNNLGLPFYSGAIFFALLLTVTIVVGLIFSRKKLWPNLNTIIWSFTLLVMGYATFAMIVIRSNANTPLDENNPENLVSLLAYLKREQYGDWPKLYGQNFNSSLAPKAKYGNGSNVHIRSFVIQKGESDIKGFTTKGAADEYIAKVDSDNRKGYKITEKYFLWDTREKTKPVYQENTFFPRMYSSDARHVSGYRRWSNYEGDKNKPTKTFQRIQDNLSEIDRRLQGSANQKEVQYYTDLKGQMIEQIKKIEAKEGLYLPTFGENFQYFAKYQVGWMYWRYFMWNFSGRQNDNQGYGNILDGNWISGVNLIDNERFGDQSKLPDLYKNYRAYNKFYLLPLLLGLIGLIFQLSRDPKRWFVVTLLFLLTGFAIVLYLNQKPIEPRERDYAYAASFYAFAIWIGLGVYSLFSAARTLALEELKQVSIGVFGLGGAVFLVELAMGNGHFFSYSVLFMGVIGVGAHFLLFLLKDKLNGQSSAIAAGLLTLAVPLLMAFEGWDDHDRSDRYTARDMARAYLDACEPNAILFTHGDNDTFPLWYVQEVEEHRRDVRVVNLSLLGTDWYVDQMMRKAYTSDPVPFSFPEEKFRQGGLLDYVLLPSFVESYARNSGEATENAMSPTLRKAYKYVKHYQDEQGKSKPLDLKAIMKFVSNDDNVVNVGGDLHSYLPSNSFSFKVDKEKAEKQVDPEDKNKIVDQMVWSVGGQGLTKNTFYILHLLAENNWERPVYFGSSAASTAYAGLTSYFQMEGLVYKLVPIKSKKNSYNYGRVNSDKMYKNLVETFKWGNMEREDVNIDYYNRRPAVNYRLQFSELAESLISQSNTSFGTKSKLEKLVASLTDSAATENPAIEEQLAESKKQIAELKERGEEQLEKAKNTLEKIVTITPAYNFPFDRTMVQIAGLYYQMARSFSNEMGDTSHFAAADKITAELLKNASQKLDYYLPMDNELLVDILDEVRTEWITLQGLKSITNSFKTSKFLTQVASAEAEYKVLLRVRLRALVLEMPQYREQIEQNFRNILAEPQQAPTPNLLPGK